MAFDGITVSALRKELADRLTGLRIVKISQPEADEIVLSIKGNSTQLKVLLSVNPSLPLVYITEESKPAPQTAPAFCMLLRKHLTNARIVSVTQPGFERILRFELEHLDEMGDLRHKFLIVELMGKYSNIIFTDEEETIIDAIKRISHNLSSVREVLAGRKWFIPGGGEKRRGDECGESEFKEVMLTAHNPVQKALYSNFEGMSPILASELCFRAGVDGDASTSSLTEVDITRLWESFSKFYEGVSKGEFTPEIRYEGRTPVEFAAHELTIYKDLNRVSFDSISETLHVFYSEKSAVLRIRQKSADLRKITQTALERNVKKLDLQRKQLEDTEKKEKYRIYGELINTYGYTVSDGAKSMEAVNYYNGESVIIPLDPQLTVKENGKRYFDKYVKLKRTAESLTGIIEEVSAQIEHLRSIETSLNLAETETDLSEIREELFDAGYIKSRPKTDRKKKLISEPLHFVSTDGFDIYVGKNNFQNDRLTFEFASGGDWWFHAKKMPGSHVILKTSGREVPDRAFEEAARYAALYSEGKDSSKVEVDYTLKKNVKKPAGANPGFVVYYTNYSMMVDL